MKGVEFIQGMLPEPTRHLAGVVPFMWKICAKKIPQGAGGVLLGGFSAFSEEQHGVNVFASISLAKNGEPIGYWMSVGNVLTIWLSIFNQSFLIVSPDSDGVFGCEVLLMSRLWESNISHIALMTDRIKQIRQVQQGADALKESWSWQVFPLPKDDPKTEVAGGHKRKDRGSSLSPSRQLALRLCLEYLCVDVPQVVLSDPGHSIPQATEVLIVPPDQFCGNSTILLLPRKGEWRYAIALPASEQVHRFVFCHPMPPTVLDAWQTTVPISRLTNWWYPAFVEVCFWSAR